jgi:hypothetical protein
VAVLVAGSGTLSPSPGGGPLIAKFTIEPPVATPGGPARIRFEFRDAQGGLREATLRAKPAGSSWRRSMLEEPVNRAIASLGPSAEGMVEASGRHQGTYTREQHGTTNLYELQVTDKAGRKSNALTAALEVRL